MVGLIEREGDSADESLSGVGQAKRFAILPHKLYQEECDVTLAVKLKRKYIS